jgi:hypothetical protein
MDIFGLKPHRDNSYVISSEELKLSFRYFKNKCNYLGRNSIKLVFVNIFAYK